MPHKTRIVIQTIDDVTVATVEDSSLIEPKNIEEMKTTLLDLIERQDRRRLILDMGKVQHLSSAALSFLIPLHNTFERAKGHLILVGVHENVMKLFKLTKLDKLLNFAASEKDALKLLGAAQSR